MKCSENMASSRHTVVRRMTDIYSYMCDDEIKKSIKNVLFFSIMADESMDNPVSEQPIVYLRYVDISQECIAVRFLGTHKIESHPKMLKTFSKGVDEVLAQYGVTKELIVSSIVDGASAMFSTRQSVVN